MYMTVEDVRTCGQSWYLSSEGVKGRYIYSGHSQENTTWCRIFLGLPIMEATDDFNVGDK